eukprot:3232098-Lingulodinium_polyedra.AAC.1
MAIWRSKCSASSGSSSSSSSRTMPAKLDLRAATALLPAVTGCMLFHSQTEDRVRGFYPCHGARASASANVTMYGLEGALKHCLQMMWHFHSRETGH